MVPLPRVAEPPPAPPAVALALAFVIKPFVLSEFDTSSGRSSDTDGRARRMVAMREEVSKRCQCVVWSVWHCAQAWLHARRAPLASPFVEFRWIVVRAGSDVGPHESVIKASTVLGTSGERATYVRGSSIETQGAWGVDIIFCRP